MANTKLTPPPFPRFISDRLNKNCNHEAKTVTRRHADRLKEVYPLSDPAKALIGSLACWLKGTPLLDELRDLFRSHTEQMQHKMFAAIMSSVLSGGQCYRPTGVKHVDILLTVMILKINDVIKNDL